MSYFPGRGDDAYRVEHYDLTLEYRVGPNRLSGNARLTAAAVRAIPRLVLDLGRFKVSRVLVDGDPARFSHRQDKLQVTPAQPIPAHRSFVVEVRYAGNPQPLPSPYGELGWEQLTDGVLVASQPTGAPSWFPCNDRPDAKAPFRIAVTADSPYHVVANGRLTGKRRSGSTTTWEYEQAEPMATYLASVQIGRYQSADLPGRVPQQLLYPGRIAAKVKHDFGDQRRMMAAFEALFGPYPFDGYTVVITDDDLEIPVEAQGMSIFGANQVDGRRGSERLVAHELAHQWYGNSLTLARWRDIWLHEGFAAYAEWLWSEVSGDRDAEEHARYWHRHLSRQPQNLVLADPGVRQLFDDRVYKRGALTLHALRRALGDDVFFSMLREWTAAHRHGTVTTEEFTDFADLRTAGDLGPFFGRWLYDTRLPSLD